MGGGDEGAVRLGRVGRCKADCLQFIINIFLVRANSAIQTLRETKNSPYLLLIKSLNVKKIICNIHESIKQLKISVFFVHGVKLSQAAQAYAAAEK